MANRRRLTRKGINAAGPQSFAGKKGPRGPVRGPKATMISLSPGKRGKQLTRAVPGAGKAMAAGASYHKKQPVASTQKSVTHTLSQAPDRRQTAAFPGFNPNAGPGRNHNKSRKP